MSDKILTDDEKDALLDSVTNGEIEVQSIDGPRYAEVRTFEIPERSRIITNSFPRLQRLNHHMVNRLSRLTEQLVNAETVIRAGAIETRQYGQFCERITDLTLVIEFTARPLKGSGLIYLHEGLVKQIVESFYGGSDNESVTDAADFFTRGESNVASLFSKDLLKMMSEAWQPLIETEHTQVAIHLGTDIIDGFDASDTVICADFDLSFENQNQSFQIVWPASMLAPLLPVFEGQKRERDAEEDARWEHAIRTRTIDSVISISSRIGHSELTLREVAELKPGDVIDIDDPLKSTIYVKHVPIIEGRFGIHAGHYAIETTGWLGPDIETSAKSPVQQA